MMRFLRMASIIACLLAGPAAQASTSYAMDRLGFLAGDGYSSARRVNDDGEVLGYSASYNEWVNGISSPFLWNQATGIVGIRADNQLEVAGDINNSGQIVGTGNSGSGVLRQPDGALVSLQGLPQAYDSSAYAINDSGWIVGASGNYAVIWEGNTTAQVIGGASTSYSYARDINKNGAVVWVESLHDANHQWVGTRSYLWARGVSTLLLSLNASDDCQAESLNDNGTIVGSSGDHAVVWDAGGNIILDLGIGTAYGINRFGQIVGVMGSRAVLWNPDGSIGADLGELAGVGMSSAAYAINDYGVIVGSAAYTEYQGIEAVRWTPVPEPSSLLALLAGMGSVVGMIRRRRRSCHPRTGI